MIVRTILLGLLFCTTSPGQHDPGRNAVRELAKGAFAKAEKTLGGKARNSKNSEGEKAMVRAISACLQGDGATALEQAKQAVADDVPFSRILAGPKDVFKPLYNAAGFEAWATPQKRPLIHGPMIGAVNATSAKVWLRTAAATKVVVEVQSDGDTFRVPGNTSADRDYTTVASFDALKPNTSYKVRIKRGGEVLGRGAFQTTAPADTPGTYSLVLGGGAGFTPKYERMWKQIEAQHPDALFLLGDNVYIDDPTRHLTHHYCYYRRQSQPDWRSLVAKTPVYAIYDDHDFGLNDCVPGPFIEKPSWKRPVWEIFRNNWVNPAYGGGDAQPGCWFDMQVNQIHFIFLDCRYYRDLSGGSMIGPVQKAWLKSRLKASTATFKVIASSVPWSAGVKPRSRDTWDGFQAEREELFSFLEKEKIEGALLISADRHRVDVRKTKRPQGYDLYEIMSSRLTNVHTHGLMEDAKGSEFIVGYNKTPGYAKLDFDTSAEPATMDCHIFDIENTLHHSVKITADQLKR